MYLDTVDVVRLIRELGLALAQIQRPAPRINSPAAPYASKKVLAACRSQKPLPERLGLKERRREVVPRDSAKP